MFTPSAFTFCRAGLLSWASLLFVCAACVGAFYARAEHALPSAPHAAARYEAFITNIRRTRSLESGVAAATRPVVAVLASNEGTETTDFLVPYAVLQRADVATVEAVAPQRGRVTLMPALAIDVANDLASFDARHPAGADYVVVPAMHRADDPAIVSFIRQQANKGAVIVAVCSGARVLAEAGLLKGRHITGHWFDRSDLLKAQPSAIYVANQRYVAERGVVTTTGVAASLPVALAMVEAIGGRARAVALATELGIEAWGVEHNSAQFALSARAVWTIAVNALAFWRSERVTIPVQDGVDDIALAFAADAWSRSYRSQAIAVTARRGDSSAARVRMLSGLTLLPAWDERVDDDWRYLMPLRVKPARQLDAALCSVGQRYGAETAAIVALQLEYAFAATSACIGST